MVWSMCPPALLGLNQICVANWSVYTGWDCWWSSVLVTVALGLASLLRSGRYKRNSSKCGCFAIGGIERYSEQDKPECGEPSMPDWGTKVILDFWLEREGIMYSGRLL